MEYSIYSFTCYSITDEKAEAKKETYNNIDDVISRINTDNKYNERLYEGQQYKFFLDIEEVGLKYEIIEKSLLLEQIASIFKSLANDNIASLSEKSAMTD